MVKKFEEELPINNLFKASRRIEEQWSILPWNCSKSNFRAVVQEATIGFKYYRHFHEKHGGDGRTGIPGNEETSNNHSVIWVTGDTNERSLADY